MNKLCPILHLKRLSTFKGYKVEADTLYSSPRKVKRVELSRHKHVAMWTSIRFNWGSLCYGLKSGCHTLTSCEKLFRPSGSITEIHSIWTHLVFLINNWLYNHTTWERIQKLKTPCPGHWPFQIHFITIQDITKWDNYYIDKNLWLGITISSALQCS